MLHNVCLTCRDNNNTQTKFRIKKLNELLSNVEPVKSHNYMFNWNFDTKCKYGLRCIEKSRTIANIERDIDVLERKLVAVALDSELRLYHETLNLLRGQFPCVYNLMVRLHSCCE